MIKKVAQSMYIEAAQKAAVEWPFATKPQSIQEEALQDVRFVHAIDPSGKGGCTIAYRRASPYDSSTMVDVAVAYCSKYDTFSKKIGVGRARDKFMRGERVQVPARKCKNDFGIPGMLRLMFWGVL